MLFPNQMKHVGEPDNEVCVLDAASLKWAFLLPSRVLFKEYALVAGIGSMLKGSLTDCIDTLLHLQSEYSAVYTNLGIKTDDPTYAETPTLCGSKLETDGREQHAYVQYST